MDYDFYQDAIGCYHDWIEYERKHFERTGVKRPAFDEEKHEKAKRQETISSPGNRGTC